MLEWGSWMGIGWGCEVLMSAFFDDNFEHFIRKNIVCSCIDCQFLPLYICNIFPYYLDEYFLVET